MTVNCQPRQRNCMQFTGVIYELHDPIMTSLVSLHFVDYIFMILLSLQRFLKRHWNKARRYSGEALPLKRCMGRLSWIKFHSAPPQDLKWNSPQSAKNVQFPPRFKKLFFTYLLLNSLGACKAGRYLISQRYKYASENKTKDRH